MPVCCVAVKREAKVLFMSWHPSSNQPKRLFIGFCFWMADSSEHFSSVHKLKPYLCCQKKRDVRGKQVISDRGLRSVILEKMSYGSVECDFTMCFPEVIIENRADEEMCDSLGPHTYNHAKLHQISQYYLFANNYHISFWLKCENMETAFVLKPCHCLL